MRQTHHETPLGWRVAILVSILLAILVCHLPARTARAADIQPVDISITPYATTSPQGEKDILLAVWITPKAGYHFYAHDPGDTGRPTDIIPGPIVQGMRVLYPKGVRTKDVFDPTATVMIHEESTPFLVRFPLAGAPESLSVTIRLLLCSDSNCWPVQKTLRADWALPLPEASEAPWWNRMADYTETFPTHDGEIRTVGTSDTAALATQMGVDLPKAGTSDLSGGNQTAPSLAVPLPATAALGAPGLRAPTTPHFDPDKGYQLHPRYHLQALEVSSMGMAMLLGLIAGFVLNFMPCVLPVISLKLSSLLSATGVADETERIRTFRQHNLWFAAGIMVWFMALAIILTLAGKAWGQIFQDERLVTGLLLLMFALGLSVFDVFELPMLSLRSDGATETGPWNAFSTGLLATLLATPCSGPFLGGVLGWAFLQPPLVMGTILMAVGLGMALPYIGLALRPGLVRRFPKPGRWTTILQRLLGFFLMGTAAYLLTILPSEQLPRILLLLWLTGLAAWLWGTFGGLHVSRTQRWGVRVLCVALIALPFAYQSGTGQQAEPWTPFTQRSFLAELGHRNLVVDFTADWCPNCKILEHTVLTDENRARWATTYDARFIRVDLTRDNPAGQALLEALGSQSIPVVALFPEGDTAGSPVVLRDLFPTDVADEAMRTAFGTD